MEIKLDVEVADLVFRAREKQLQATKEREKAKELEMMLEQQPSSS